MVQLASGWFEGPLSSSRNDSGVARGMRVGLGVLALVLGFHRLAFAEWQLKPFLGVTFGGETTFYDFDHAVGSTNVVFGERLAPRRSIWCRRRLRIRAGVLHERSGTRSQEAELPR